MIAAWFAIGLILPTLYLIAGLTAAKFILNHREGA